MCGITGFITGQPTEQDFTQLKAMTQALHHRGPDGQGLYQDKVDQNKTESALIGLGHRRLSILDISDAGHQPMADDTGSVVVSYNGEIYNYQDLRRQIERQSDYRFRSTCDTEVLPIGYKLWGLDLFDKLEGMFAIAIWDKTSQRLTLARDGAGIKPLYLYRPQGQDPKGLYFASEIKAFLTLDHRFEFSAPDLHSYFTNGYVDPTGATLKGVSQIAPGSFSQFDAKGQLLIGKQFWHPARQGTITSLEEAQDKILATLSQVVTDMMVSDVPVGIMQSGGIDSSLISYSARNFDVPLFTASFSAAEFDEHEDAEAVSKHIGARHHVVPIQANQDPTAILSALAHATDAQLSDSSGYALYQLCQTIRQHVTVALSGEGGDEFFAGYPTYRASRFASALSPWLPKALASGMGRSALAMNRGRDGRVPLAEKLGRFLLGYAQAGQEPHTQWRRYLFQHQKAFVYGPAMQDYLNSNPMAGYEASIAQAQGPEALDRWMVGDQSYYLPGDMLVKGDRISMAHSLEVRVPFMDRRIMALAGDLHHSLLTSLRGPDKNVLRQSLEQLQAQVHTNNPATTFPNLSQAKKRGFMVPIAQMLTSEFSQLCDDFFDKQPDAFAPWLQPDGLRRLWREHKTRQGSHHYFLWSLLIWRLWAQNHKIL